MPGRDYTPLLDRLPGPGAAPAEPAAAMARVVDALWDAFKSEGISWVGFNTWSSRRPEEMVLGPRRETGAQAEEDRGRQRQGARGPGERQKENGRKQALHEKALPHQPRGPEDRRIAGIRSSRRPSSPRR